jgi:hypothetical protein
MKRIWHILKNTSGVFAQVQDLRERRIASGLVYKDLPKLEYQGVETDIKNLQGDIKRFAGDCWTAFYAAKKKLNIED